MALLLIGVPLVLALLAFVTPSARVRPWIVTVGGVVQLGLAAVALTRPVVGGLNGWLFLDPVGRVMLGLLATLFTAASVYVPGYLSQRSERPNRVFCSAVLALTGMLSLVAQAHHLGLMWVGLEASTLLAAPLVYFNKNPRSIEATWKYLMVGSVGIALALLGSFFLAYAALQSGREASLLLEDLVRNAPAMSRAWLHAAFVVLLIGYGTKMGIAPMHTWKPDAYGEAPGLVGTLLAGCVTSGAFLAILRVYRICAAAGEAEFARKPLVALGLCSMLVAGVFMARQKDYKRMLAYSSVEHMGILVLGIGIGGAATFGALLHMLNNGLTKGILFLAAANIHRAYGSKSTDQVSGALRRVPISGALMLAGFFAVTGSPPFGPFISEFTILNAAISSGQFWIGAFFLLFLIVIFVGMGATVLAVVQGEPGPEPTQQQFRERFLTVAPGLGLLGLVLLLGLWIPAPVRELLESAAASLEAR